MKRKLSILTMVLCLFIIISSCKKENEIVASTTLQGTWVGTGQYGTSGGNPTYPFSITFKAGGSVEIIGNNSTGVDNATGTWQLVQDTVTASYKYDASSAIYSLAAKFSSNSTIMTGTIGLGSATTGTGIFTVTKQ